MMKRLTDSERLSGLIIASITLLGGLFMAAGGLDDPMGTHGWIVVLLAGVAAVVCL